MPDSARPSLPGWPAVLSEDMAAAYLSLSAGTFRAQVADQVRPIKLTMRRIGWRRADLDAWIAKQGHGGATLSDEPVNSWDRLLGT